MTTGIATGLTGDFSAETPLTLWHEGLTPEQRIAAGSSGAAHRMLAGPGTGKTLVMTHHVLYLVQEKGVQSDDILVLTFTRAATFELRKRIRLGLGEGGGLPKIYTLHAFALGQLMRNQKMMRDLNQPLRIADDWEQRWIIEEDLKRLIQQDVEYVKDRFSDLSADWSTLKVDADEWEALFPDPLFLATWRKHRAVYGYSLRAELVYQLKRCIQEFGEKFLLDKASHVLVDEYQDLNPCDLAVIRYLVSQGSEPYVAGDDDQSIYGFRHAFPRGIREYPDQYNPCTDGPLTLCKRCDEAILELGVFVAKQDIDRIPKDIKHEEGREGGHVHILRFRDQYREASGVAAITKHLLDSVGYRPHEVLILLRADKNRAFSKVFNDAFSSLSIPVATTTGDTPFDTVAGRKMLNVLRLAGDSDDHLALRSLLQLTSGIGDATWDKLYEMGVNNGETFCQTVRRVVEDPKILAGTGGRVASVATLVWTLAGEISTDLNKVEAPTVETFKEYVLDVAKKVASGEPDLDELLVYVEDLIRLSEARDLPSFFHALQSVSDDVDNLVQTGKVNIMTMHKAKGLTAPVVFVVACDDGFLPGRNEAGRAAEDERRLLYVSLTRAEHHLYVTYATERKDQQFHSGRHDEDARRLTRFLRDAPLQPESGSQFAHELGDDMACCSPKATRTVGAHSGPHV